MCFKPSNCWVRSPEIENPSRDRIPGQSRPLGWPQGRPLKGIGPVQPLDRPRRWRVIRPCPPPGIPGRPGHVQPLDRSRRWRVIRPCPHARTPAWPGGGPWGLALAQSGRAPGCSPGGCWFESSRSDPFWISALGPACTGSNGGLRWVESYPPLSGPATSRHLWKYPNGDPISGSNPRIESPKAQGIPHA